MDRGARAIRYLIAGAALVLAGAVLAAPRARMQALTWTTPGAERAVLLRQPVACLDPAPDPLEVSYGRALFNAPQLLGGQTARAGISCASCHANGRRSAAFFLDGVSGEPGTADVSASFFSIARANRHFDPKPIPDLAAPGKVSRDPATRGLEQFTRGLIVDEFAGREPAATELSAVSAYLRALRPCVSEREESRGLDADLELLRDTIGAAERRADLGDDAGTALMVSAARFRLGLIEERYVGPRLATARRQLLAASRALQPMGEAKVPSKAALQLWRARFERDIVPRLIRGERRSLYDPRRVEAWLAGG